MTSLLRPITTLDLDTLLGTLRDHEQEVLRLIDEDEHLKKRERPDGLIVANSGPTLFEPTHEHQLFAKGIVYVREPEYRFVSIPLVKMFNHGLREHSDTTSQALLAKGNVGFSFPEKLDGTMIHMFAHEDGVVFTTRSVIEGAEIDEEGPYLALARETLEEQNPELLSGEAIEGLSLIFELIHPKTKQVTNYGAQKRMVLLSIFDQDEMHYWSNARVLAWAAEHEVDAPAILIEDENFERGVERLREQLATDPDIPEGSIVCFERDGRIVHRVKVKTAEYLHHFALRMKVTYKTVVEMLWNRPDLHRWEDFLEHLIDEKMSEEEVEAFYKEYFDEFTQWYSHITETHARIEKIYKTWEREHGARPNNTEARRAWFKKLAVQMKIRDKSDFSLIMGWARGGGLTLEDLMLYEPAYPGFRQLVTDARAAASAEEE